MQLIFIYYRFHIWDKCRGFVRVVVVELSLGVSSAPT
jgi:hypothetical protein